MTRRNVKYDIALNGEEAVEKWRTGTFHLILVSLFAGAQHELTDV